MSELKHQIPIRASSEKLYAAIATEAGLKGWWTVDTTMQEKVGGKAVFGFDKRGMVFHMDVATLEPGKRVVFKCRGDHPEWEGTTLTWEIEEGDGASILTFTHSGWASVTDFCASCNTVWGELLHRLKGVAEGKKPGPHWPD